jgi:hypothetical protein
MQDGKRPTHPELPAGFFAAAGPPEVGSPDESSARAIDPATASASFDGNY